MTLSEEKHVKDMILEKKNRWIRSIFCDVKTIPTYGYSKKKEMCLFSPKIRVVQIYVHAFV